MILLLTKLCRKIYIMFGGNKYKVWLVKTGGYYSYLTITGDLYKAKFLFKDVALKNAERYTYRMLLKKARIEGYKKGWNIYVDTH